MSCKALKLNSCEIKGSTFAGRKFTFPNRDISEDTFVAKVRGFYNSQTIAEIQGAKDDDGNVYFSKSILENNSKGNYTIEYWATFLGIATELIAVEDFKISLDACDCGDSEDSTFTLTFTEETIEYSVEIAVINIGGGGGESLTPLQIKTRYESNANTNAFTDNEKTKLQSLQNYNDAPLNASIGNKVDKVNGKQLSDENYSSTEKNKLANLQNFDSSALNSAIDLKVDKVTGKGLSTNDYTTAEKEKLAGLESNLFKGKFSTLTALNLVIGESGAYAYVGEAGKRDVSYIWDDDDVKWELNQSVTTTETPSSIKTKYESNPDTNVFTDSEKTKLSGLNNFDPSAINSALENKVEKESGKGLSQNDFTNTLKTKLDSLQNYSLPVASGTVLGGVKEVFLTQSQYDALTPKLADVKYHIEKV